MDIVEFIQGSDPFQRPRLGALLPDGETLVDLQAGHFAMTEAPNPQLRDLAGFEQGGDHAREVARKVVDWVRSQQPPGTRTHLEAVRVVKQVGGEG